MTRLLLMNEHRIVDADLIPYAFLTIASLCSDIVDVICKGRLYHACAVSQPAHVNQFDTASDTKCVP